MKKYVAYDRNTFEFKGFFNEGRKDLPKFAHEVDPVTFLRDKGQHTHYNPDVGFYTDAAAKTSVQVKRDRAWRDSMLSYTDKYVLPDYPLLGGELVSITQYRQALRDYPVTWVRPRLPKFATL